MAALPRHELARLVSKVVIARAQPARRRAGLAIERRAEHERAEGQPVLARRHESHLRRVFEALEADGCLLERERRGTLGGGAGGRTVIAQLGPVKQDRVDGGDERLAPAASAARASSRTAASSSIIVVQRCWPSTTRTALRSRAIVTRPMACGASAEAVPSATSRHSRAQCSATQQ